MPQSTAAAESADGDKPVSTSGYQGTSDASPPPKRQRDTSPGKAKDLSPAVLAALGRELKSACEADAPLRALRLILAGADADDASTIEALPQQGAAESVLCEQLLLLHATPETKQQEAEGVTAALFVEGGASATDEEVTSSRGPGGGGEAPAVGWSTRHRRRLCWQRRARRLRSSRRRRRSRSSERRQRRRARGEAASAAASAFGARFNMVADAVAAAIEPTSLVGDEDLGVEVDLSTLPPTPSQLLADVQPEQQAATETVAAPAAEEPEAAEKPDEAKAKDAVEVD